MNIFTIDSYTLYYLFDFAIGKIMIIGTELYLNNGLNEQFNNGLVFKKFDQSYKLNSYQ